MLFNERSGFYMAELDYLHDYVMIILIAISYLLTIILFRVMSSSYFWGSFVGSQSLEFIWTVVPAIILFSLAIPSLRLLYILDEGASDHSFRIKVVGHQWYWSYEYMDLDALSYDSYMVQSADLTSGFRVLDADMRLVVPYGARGRVFVTAADVLHSWAVPSLGIKVDATPGRLGQVYIWASRPGVVYGQCSEICGANHSLMPIRVECISGSKYAEWLAATGRSS